MTRSDRLHRRTYALNSMTRLCHLEVGALAAGDMVDRRDMALGDENAPLESGEETSGESVMPLDAPRPGAWRVMPCNRLTSLT